MNPDAISKEIIERLNRLNDVAGKRGQSLAQLAIAWLLQCKGLTTALIGASQPEQITDCVGALKNLSLSSVELKEISKILSYQQQ